MPSLLSAAALALDHLDDLILESAHEVHTGIAGRVRWGVRPLGGSLAMGAHDGISRLVYGSLGAGLRGSSRALRTLDHCTPSADLEASTAGRFVSSAVNGLIGDHLRDAQPDFAFASGVRRSGLDVALDQGSVLTGFPDHTDALVVFIHGLCENEDVWRRRRRPRPVGPDPVAEPGSYGERLVEHGWTPVDLRINTGVPIAEIGVEVHALLERLVEVWPQEVHRIALVGHSMGGLVARTALAVASDRDENWTGLVTDLVTLGTPHLGSPVERMIERGLVAAGELPELAPYRRVFTRRSAGVRDLHDGLPDDALELPHLRHHLVAGTLTKSARHPLARTVGDLLVPPRSALAMSVRGQQLFPDADRLHVPGAGHFDLLNHDSVYAALQRWLGEGAERQPSRGHVASAVPEVIR